MASCAAKELPEVLGIADLNDVITSLEETGFPYDQWSRLGLVIGIIYTELECIRAKHKDPKDCLTECLTLWLQQKYDTDKYGSPSMESLANAARIIGLRAVSLGLHKALPSQLKETTTLNFDPDISQSLTKLHTKFATLVAEMRRRLANHIKNNKIELINIARYVGEYLDIRGLTNAKSIDDLFDQIRAYYYFLNCPVIEYIATLFLTKKKDSDLQKKIRDYSHELESFKESTMLSDLLSVIHTALDSRSNNDTAIKFVLKFNSQWENQTIKGLELFLSDYFNRSDLFNYIQISQGCLCITFLVPRSHFQYLIDVATPKLKEMRQMGVLQLVINDNVFIDENDTVSDDELSIEAVQSGDTVEKEMLLLLGDDPYYYSIDSAMSLGEGDKMKSIESQGYKKSSQDHNIEPFDYQCLAVPGTFKDKCDNDTKSLPKKERKSSFLWMYTFDPPIIVTDEKHTSQTKQIVISRKFGRMNEAVIDQELVHGLLGMSWFLHPLYRYTNSYTFVELGVFGNNRGDYRSKSITTNTFKNHYLLTSRHCSVIWPSIVLIGGLPGANKSVILQNLLTRYVRKADGSAMTIDRPASMKIYEIVAIGNKHQMLYWSEVTTLNKRHNFCIASALLHDCDSDNTELHLIRDVMSGTFSNKILDKHFHAIYADLITQEFLKPIDKKKKPALEDSRPKNFWNKFLSGGLSIMNFWDVGFNNEITQILNAFSGHFCNCYPCLFLDLKRDEKLFTPMDESEYIDRNFLHSWWPRILYLLQCALFAKPNEMVAKKCRQFMNMSKSCLIVAVHNGDSTIDVPDKVERLQKVLELVSEQMGLADILDFDILEFNTARADSYRALKSRLERRITNEHIDFPSKWIFLHSAFYEQSKVYIERKEYESMASECNIVDEEFESFLTTFTASGSLIYAADMLPEYVILKPLAFLTKLAKLFLLHVKGDTKVSHGIVSLSAAIKIFGDDVEFYTTVATSLNLAIHLDINKLDTAASTIMLNEESSIYFVPALRHSNPITECHKRSLHIFINFDIAPKCTEVLLIKSAFKVFPKHDLMITLTPREEMNVIQFFVSSGQDSRHHVCWFELVYHGNSFEIRLHVDDTPEEVCQNVRCAIVATFRMTFEEHRKLYGLMKFDFGFICQGSAGVRHYLPGFTSCTSCTPNPHFNQWTNAIEQAHTGTDYNDSLSLCKNPLLWNEIIKIAEYIVSACDNNKLEELARKLNMTFDLNKMTQRGKMKYVMQMLMNWEEKVDMPRIVLGQIMTELELHELAAAMKLFV